jgi:uncharacterized paraquat-inducible protein A
MVDINSESGLVACEECGGAHSADRLAGDGTATCPRCGNDSFTDIHNPSTL